MGPGWGKGNKALCNYDGYMIYHGLLHYMVIIHNIYIYIIYIYISIVHNIIIVIIVIIHNGKSYLDGNGSITVIIHPGNGRLYYYDSILLV